MAIYQTFFLFSAGLAHSLTVPLGTKAAIAKHVAEVEGALGIRRTRYEDNPEHWSLPPRWDDVDAEILCKTAMVHNPWVRGMRAAIDRWATEPTSGQTEEMTPEDAATFWPALRFIDPPVGMWTIDYYRDRMDHLYDVLRGHEDEGVSLGARAMSPAQAGAVIELFAHYLDGDDIRLAVPHGHDRLASSYHGEYDWCSPESQGDKGGCYRAIAPGDEQSCRRRRCPLRERHDDA